MIMTSFIKEHLKDDLFIELLQEYGSWCRYSGCISYNSYKDSYTYIIDDDSALVIDKCFQLLKKVSNVLFDIMMLTYQSKLDPLDIHVLLLKNKKYKKLHLNHDEISEMITIGNAFILKKIKEIIC